MGCVDAAALLKKNLLSAQQAPGRIEKTVSTPNTALILFVIKPFFAEGYLNAIKVYCAASFCTKGKAYFTLAGRKFVAPASLLAAGYARHRNRSPKQNAQHSKTRILRSLHMRRGRMRTLTLCAKKVCLIYPLVP